MDRDRAVETLRSAGLPLEAAWLEAFAPSAVEWEEYLAENAGSPKGERYSGETDQEFVRRIGFLILSWLRWRNGASADERELGLAWHSTEELFEIRRPETLVKGPWEIRPNWTAESDEDF